MKNKIEQFIKFGIVGLSNTIISYFIYLILVFFKINYILANIVGFIVSILNAFYWNNKYVFKTKRKRTLWITFLKTFLSYAGTGLILNNLLLIIWVQFLNISQIIAPIINLFITIPLNFILNKMWAFKSE